MSKRQFTERIGAKDPTLAGYKLPEPDVTVRPVDEDGNLLRGSFGGWTEETIDEWNANRPGRGARTDLK
ncbi:hypothetical protein [Williamsia muralis]|uniref:hypothetical protein n=1 Tax=Williamsia marianensis TaxID=85044 RepID=UPI000E3256FA|nr:hypothetical protein [Williamsia marianensis]